MEEGAAPATLKNPRRASRSEDPKSMEMSNAGKDQAVSGHAQKLPDTGDAQRVKESAVRGDCSTVNLECML